MADAVSNGVAAMSVSSDAKKDGGDVNLLKDDVTGEMVSKK
jgi:hypothetical protein